MTDLLVKKLGGFFTPTGVPLQLECYMARDIERVMRPMLMRVIEGHSPLDHDRINDELRCRKCDDYHKAQTLLKLLNSPEVG